jgi:hypothetical protein
MRHSSMLMLLVTHETRLWMAQRPVHFWYEMALPLRHGIRRASAVRLAIYFRRGELIGMIRQVLDTTSAMERG